MKYIAALCSLVLLSFFAGAQTFESKDFAERTASHKIVAILPVAYKVSDYSLIEDLTEVEIKESEKKSAQELQRSMYSYLLNKAKHFSVEFQDVNKTNLLLKKAGVNADSLANYLPEELAKILQVDGVIIADIRTDHLMDREIAMAAAYLGGVGMRTNESEAFVALYDGKDGKLIWKYSKEANGWVGATADDTVDKLMRKLARKFPYTK